MTATLATIEATMRRDRLIVIACLAAISALSWLYLVGMALDMGDMSMGDADSSAMAASEAMMAMRAQPWDLAYFLAMFVMWAIMMVGMMIPSAAPMILLYARIQRKQGGQAPYISTGLFTAGYLLIWTVFSLLAAGLQWGLTELSLLDAMMTGTSAWFAGGLFLAAGLYQLSPLKHACLKHCQSPLHFISHHWRKGTLGPLRMGVEHGAYCLGCCWVVMALLFTLGVMNLLWVAVIAVFVLLEKVVPLMGGRFVMQAGAAAMIGAGLLFLARGAGLA
jgi:predicted metal-binding membrane protein